MNVYLSFTRDAKAHAERLARELKRHDLTALLDKEQIATGESWSSASGELLRSADAYVFLIGSQRGRWVEREWSRAVEESWSHPDKRMIPILLAGAKAPSFLLDRQPLNVRQAEPDWDRLSDKIVRALHGEAAPGEHRSAPMAVRREQDKRLRTLEKQASRLEPTGADLRREAKQLESRLVRQREAGDAEAGPTATRLADVMRSLKDRPKAIQYLEIALELYKRRPGKADPALARIHANLGSLLLQQRKYSDARPHLEQAVIQSREASGDDTMTYALAEYRLAKVLDRLGDQRSAATHRNAATRAMRDSLGKIPIVGQFLKLFMRSSTKRKTAKRKTTKRKTAKRKTAKRKTAKRKTTKRKTAKRKTTKRKTAKRKTAKRKTTKRKTAKRKTTKRKTAKRKNAKRKTAKRKTTKRKTTKRKTTKRKTARKSATRKNVSKKGSAKS